MKNKEKIVLDIYNRYPLTLLQRLRIMDILNNDMKKKMASDKFVNCVFNTIFTPIETDCEIDNEFEKHIKKCLADFFTFEYCIEHNIKHKPNIKNLNYLKDILKDLSNTFSIEDLEPLLFRTNAESLTYCSNYAYSSLEQFKTNKTKKK
ncbi:MAG: hypothetical protein J6B98_00630 [Bacilli bacterium]|nr:hypothetical protein [Bacilli bacterium]